MQPSLEGRHQADRSETSNSARAVQRLLCVTIYTPCSKWFMTLYDPSSSISRAVSVRSLQMPMCSPALEKGRRARISAFTCQHFPNTLYVILPMLSWSVSALYCPSQASSTCPTFLGFAKGVCPSPHLPHISSSFAGKGFSVAPDVARSCMYPQQLVHGCKLAPWLHPPAPSAAAAAVAMTVAAGSETSGKGDLAVLTTVHPLDVPSHPLLQMLFSALLELQATQGSAACSTNSANTYRGSSSFSCYGTSSSTSRDVSSSSSR